MVNWTRDFFICLSNSKFLNKSAQKWGFRFGAEKFVAGTDIGSVTRTIKEMNARGISCTVDNLGEFVSEKTEAESAKRQILNMLDKIREEKLDCHVSVKLTQLGLDISREFCIQNMLEILARAEHYGIFINVDMEDYAHFQATIDVLKILLQNYGNVGTVIQAYLRCAEDVMDELKDIRLRIVKGAYKESEAVAFQTKAEIDRNYLKLAKKRLLGDAYTSIATHDHNIIRALEDFIRENNISHEKFEFQMLYGFRQEMQYELAEKYHFTTYMPFGNDWFGYYMRRLAERPQNINLIVKDVFYTKDHKLKKEPLLTGALAVSLLLLWRKSGKKK
ncbi:proline dehydrogenase [Weizmannia acidilactici]|uniref:proline dehydrogenase n=1 Tax=Weizmannia acidilactici TaxID=2607726 RepID=A0A5J4JGH9_9BACI|nr:proline dehydrogenase family protein [Weizmannia acidilactici]GER66416.1 proline dehydrogenase [Weizmannia acidilactici]GER69438.1 proline dehydrogenase [Weizmannia acidilactici]GER72233.1 proline dehydrogenase [Weizmannia acidilactici]